MSTLLDLQRDFGRALLTGDDRGVRDLIESDGLRIADRIDVYRNNVVSSLTEALAETYPAVCRLVDPRFFGYAAHQFLTAHPPARPCLAEYGAAFADFIAEFEPCRHLEYLADVARLEWLVHLTAHAPDAAPVPSSVLASFAPEDTPRLLLALQPSLSHLESKWPVHRIWAANRDAESGADAVIDIGSGRAHLEVVRGTQGVLIRTLDATGFAFRDALRRGLALEAATDVALEVDPDFDLAKALGDLFSTSSVISVGLAPVESEGPEP